MQRSYLLLIFLIFPLALFGQTHETFSDSNFASNPAWEGETAFFNIPHTLELQSNGPNTASQLHLSTSNHRCRDTEWNFYAKLDFDITTSNWAKFYLTSDRSNTENNPKGYYVKFDGNSNSIDLFRQDSTVHTKMISGKSGRAGKTSMNIFRIKVICDPYGNWFLFSDTTASGTHFKKEGNVLDTTFSSSSFCGVYFAHSATRRTQFYFDDLTIAPAPLSLLSAQAISSTEVTLIFNRELNSASMANVLNYSFLPGNNSVESFSLDPQNQNRVTLHLTNPLSPSVLYTLTVPAVPGNPSEAIGFLNSTSFRYRINTHYGDLLMTELLPDPSPSVGLPEVEFVELLNTTNDTLELQDFIFSDGNSEAFFPSFKIAPHQYVLLCPASNVPLFSTYAPVIGLSNFPSLNNSGDPLVLKNQQRTILHRVQYSDVWYGDLDKKEGGWSLEMIDVLNPCGEGDNWMASIDASGGTPGKINSVAAQKPDLSPPQLVRAAIVDSIHVQVLFDEKPDAPSLSSSQFHLDKNMVQNISVSSENAQLVVLEVAEKFTKGELYTLTLSGIRDCNGNSLYPAVPVTLVMPEEASSENIRLNEVLFNPRSGGYDFVELYNRSEKYIDLKNWQLANTADGIVANKKTISQESLVLKPHEYIAFTENKTMLLHHYPMGRSERIFQLPDLPSYNDDTGSVVLLDSRGQEHDQFGYSEEFHFALIDNKEGISLERISSEEITNNSHNWHSASSSSGYATPGYKNSESIENKEGTLVWVEPKIFTPDENGYKDFALIHYKFDSPGNMANITVFDSYGREIIQLARNELLATEGFYRWDGNNLQNGKVRSGAYIIYFELFNLKGEVKKYKEVVVVGWDQNGE